MDRLIGIETLVTEARSAGLRLRLDGELLRINGNRKATAIAKELLNRKAEVIEYLAAQPETAAGAVENVGMHDSALLADEPDTSSMLLADEPAEVCPICYFGLKEQRGKHFRHLWCSQPGHFDSWRAQRGRRLSDTDASFIREREGKQ